jgi:hypothetical protein
MDNTSIIIIIVLAIVTVVVMFGLIISCRRHSKRLYEHIEPEYDRTVQTIGSGRKRKQS